MHQGSWDIITEDFLSATGTPKEKMFDMPKFRTMKVGTSAVATHLLKNPAGHLTVVGGFSPKQLR